MIELLAQPWVAHAIDCAAMALAGATVVFCRFADRPPPLSMGLCLGYLAGVNLVQAMAAAVAP